MPFNLGFTHLMVIGIVALVVLGPDRLPEVARTAGNLYREWKRISGDLQTEVREVISEFTEPISGPLNELRDTARMATGHAPPPSTTAAPPDAPLTISFPALGPSTGLVSPGPTLDTELPLLGPPAVPGTFVPFTPPQAGTAS